MSSTHSETFAALLVECLQSKFVTSVRLEVALMLVFVERSAHFIHLLLLLRPRLFVLLPLLLRHHVVHSFSVFDMDLAVIQIRLICPVSLDGLGSLGSCGLYDQWSGKRAVSLYTGIPKVVATNRW